MSDDSQNQLAKIEEVVIDPLSGLSEAEKAALDLFRSNYKKGGTETQDLSPRLAVELYSLYLSGCSLQEIAEANPQIGLGPIVASAVDGRWLDKKRQYTESLLMRASEQMIQIAAEGATFMSLVFAATHKKHGAKLKRYIQTEDPKHLQGDVFVIDSLAQYKQAVEIARALTGQDQIKKVQVSGKVEHEEKKPEPPTLMEVATSIAQLAAKKRETELNNPFKRKEDKE